MVPPAHMFKNRLQEYAQKSSLPLPVYDTVNEGKDHLPQFKCTVTINGTKYESPPGFNNKKAAQHAAAKVAVEDLQIQGLLNEYKEKIRPKNVLAELASSRNMPSPTYRFTRTITATVQVNGVSYTGSPSNNHKEAANKAALEAVMAIDPQYCNRLSHVELNANNDSEQPSAECDASKFESKMSAENETFDNQLLGGTEPHSAENPTSDNQLLGGTQSQPAENLTSDNQLPGGTESQSVENGVEKLNVDNALALEKDSEKKDVENPCAAGQGLENPMVKDEHEAEKGVSTINDVHSEPAEQPHNHSQQDSLSAQQGLLKKETEAVYQDKEHGSEEMQQISQELDLTESISKRSRKESENGEEMSQRKKKNRTETGTA